MKALFFAVAAVAVIVSACGGEGGEGAESQTTALDTTVMPGTDTVTQPMAAPAPDTAMTTTATATDTMQGATGAMTADTATQQ